MPLTARAHGTWFGTVPGVRAGPALRRCASTVPGTRTGLRYNPAKLLLDPYARAIEGEVAWTPPVFGHRVGATSRGDNGLRDDRDSAPYVPRCVVVDDGVRLGRRPSARRSLAETVIYEVHVKNLTAAAPGVPDHLRGTYAGLAHPAVIEHLTRLGVTAVELLPVHTFTTEPELRRGAG